MERKSNCRKGSCLGVVLFFALLANGFSQNLVPNPSYETYISCPTGTFQYNRVATWTNPNAASPEYFNACGSGGGDVPTNSPGSQLARTGNAYVGQLFTWLSSNYREYCQVQLTSALVAGQTYRVEYYVSLADGSSYASDKFHMHLGVTAPTSGSSNNLPVSPSLAPTVGFIGNKTGWERICGTYTATGGERFLTIGNFFPSSTSPMNSVGGGNAFCGSGGYYYVDDVSVIVGNCGVLPADIVTFAGELTGPGEVSIDWKTNAEREVAQFELQRSSSTDSYETVATRSGMGNAPMGNSYHVLDYLPVPGNYYYRLKIIDLNGSESFSEAILVESSADDARPGLHQFYPTNPEAGNPIHFVWVQGQTGRLQVSILDLNGRKVSEAAYEVKEGANFEDISTHNLKPGIYLVQFLSASASATQRIRID